MQATVQYTVEIDCAPCPAGYERQITRQLQTAFPVTSCQHTDTGLLMRLTSSHPFTDGALKDFADQVGETLSGLGITMTTGVVRMETRQVSCESGIVRRVQGLATAITGFDWRPAREVPVLYFYKGLRFDLDLSARLQATPRRHGFDQRKPVHA